MSQTKYPANTDFPKLDKHNNFMAKVLTEPLYAKYRDVKTPNGFTFDQAIQTGLSPSDTHPKIAFAHTSLPKTTKIDFFADFLHKVITFFQNKK